MKRSQNIRGNILLVANWESNVGYAWWLMENFWITIERHFSRSDITSHLIYPNITKLPLTIASSDIKTSELDLADHSIKNLIRIYRYIKTNNIRYIYLSDSPTYSRFYLFLRASGIKKIVVHDHTPGERSKPAYWLKIVKIIIQHIPLYTADHFIAVTDYVNKRHLEVNCIPKQKCSIASNGIQPLDIEHSDLNYAHNEFKIPNDRIIVITTGRACFYKGIDFFIHCADELVNKQRLLQFHFLFCGDGPDMNDFITLCKELGLEDHFTFSGRRSDIRKILPSCDIGFHASLGEVGYSLSILEYMSAGLLTIVPDNPSTSGSIDTFKTGILYHEKDVNSACEAIKAYLNSNLIDQIARHAIKKVTINYNIKNTNAMLISTLEKIYI